MVKGVTSGEATKGGTNQMKKGEARNGETTQGERDEQYTAGEGDTLEPEPDTTFRRFHINKSSALN